jgi:ribosomal protein L19E
MNAVALRMLAGDPAKYLGLVVGIAFATMLMSQQVSIFIGLMLRTASQVLDVRDADVWVMDSRVQYVDEVEPLTDTQLLRVRGVPGDGSRRGRGRGRRAPVRPRRPQPPCGAGRGRGTGHGRRGARIEEAAAEVATAKAERDRYARLARQDFASAQRDETASADARKAEAGLRLAEAGLASAREQLKVLAASQERARAEREAASAAAEWARVDLDKTVVRARLDATVLSVDLRPGERVGGGPDEPDRTPPVRLGQLRPLHVRVDVDEADAWRVAPGAPARAQLRGNPAIAADLAFVRVEPYVRPKRNLASAGPERVDTRVLQAIYAVDPEAFPARVGQQVDVFIAAGPTDTGRVPVASARP